MEWLDTLDAVDAATRRRPFQPFRHAGLCPACRSEVVFAATGPWLRDEYVCEACGAIPRERAVAAVFRHLVRPRPGLVVHESSPCSRGFSRWLAHHCPGLIATHYWGPERLGEVVNGYRNEDLSALTFADATIDVHVTQDVLEHVFDVDAVAREIRRTLKPGGLHIFTTPMVNKDRPTVQRAVLEEGRVRHLVEPPAYHGNPISAEGSLVTYDFGFDLAARIDRASGTQSSIRRIDNLRYGIRAEYIEVVISRRPPE